MDTEWKMLMYAEGIQIGNKIEVETDDGDTETMTLVKYTEKTVTLRNSFKELIKFSTESLESKDTDSRIIGKAS